MHVALTDVLTCPRCGPGHGLILLPEEVRDRRVVTGVLGCADCRERYLVRGGVGELAVGESIGEVAGEEMAREDGEEEAVRLAGLLGLAEGQGVVLLTGGAAAHAGALGRLVPGVEVAATAAKALSGASTLRTGRSLPFQSGKLRGVALTGTAAEPLLEEGARVLAPLGRLLVEPAPPDARARLEAAGLRVLAEEHGVLVAGR